MSALVKSGKAQNEHITFALPPKRTSRPGSICPLGAALPGRVTALGASDPRRGLRSYERDCAAKTNASAVVSLAPKKHLFLNVRRERLLVSPIGKKFCDINERHNPF
jgi:hypothetical protein